MLPQVKWMAAEPAEVAASGSASGAGGSVSGSGWLHAPTGGRTFTPRPGGHADGLPPRVAPGGRGPRRTARVHPAAAGRTFPVEGGDRSRGGRRQGFSRSGAVPSLLHFPKAMSPDVEHLLAALRAPGFGYREAGARPAAAGSSPDIALDAPAGERVIVVASPLGGAGRTTVASGLAHAIAAGGLATLALDLDPADALRRGFDRADAAAPGGEASPPACVPHGAPSAYLAAVAAGPEAVVLDTPAGASTALEDGLASADEVVAVLRPDAASRAAIPAFDAILARARLRSGRRFRARYVVNAFDGRRAPDRAELAAIRELLGPRLWPRALQWDPDVARARRGGRVAVEAAPASQLALEVGLLARDVMPALRPGARAR